MVNEAKDNYIGDISMSSIHNTSKHSFEEIEKSESNHMSSSKIQYYVPPIAQSSYGGPS